MSEHSENVVRPTEDGVCERCGGTQRVTIAYTWRGAVCDADDQPCPECSDETPPHVERAIASEGGQGG
jgi:hypothetical protein